jgi:hypothetical protein
MLPEQDSDCIETQEMDANPVYSKVMDHRGIKEVPRLQELLAHMAECIDPRQWQNMIFCRFGQCRCSHPSEMALAQATA